MAPQEHSYRQPAAQPQTQYQSPFQQSSPDDYEVSGSEVDSDNQPIMSHLLRRSRSLTDANFTLELQPSGRRRSFFSKRRPKATQEQAALPTTYQGGSFTTQGRSLSGLLPNQASVSEPDSKPPTGSKRTDSKSFRAKADSDTDATRSRPKSARWWSWSSSSKGVKPDGKVPPPPSARSPAGSNSRPTSLDLQLHRPQPNRTTSSAALAQTSPLAQPGCMSMFTAAPGQPEKRVSDVSQTDSEPGSRRDATALSNGYTCAPNVGGNPSYAANGSMLEEDRSPIPLSQQSKPAGHSRHVFWEDTSHEAAMIGGLQDSGTSQDPFTSSLLVHQPPGDSPRSSGSQGNSLLPHSPQAAIPSPSPAKGPVSAGPDCSSAAGPSRMVSDAAGGTLPASAAAAGAATRQAPADSESAPAVQAGDGEKQKKGHRRGRSLGGLIPTLKTKPKRSQSQHLEAEPTTPAAGSSSSSGQAGRPKTPDSKAAGSNSSSLGQCFGMGRTLDEADQEERPLGVVGLRNLGNTCFVNVALQCLRYTPKLPQAIYPDLVRFSLLEQEPVALPDSPDSPTAAASNHNPSHSGSELPSVLETTPLAHQPVGCSDPALDSQANGPSGSILNHPYPQHSMHDTGQAHQTLYSAEPQQSEHSMSQPPQIPMLQLLQDHGGREAHPHPHPHPSQPVSIPPSHTGMAPHSHPASSTQEQQPGSAPDGVAAAASASNVNSLASSDTSDHTVSVSDSPGGVPGTPGPYALAQNPLLQQQQQELQQQQQQQQHPQQQQQQQYTMASADPTPGDDSEQAPANQSTAARQPPPVAVPQVPLKKGEIAESFRTLVKQVYVKGNQEAVDPAQFLRRIAQLPMGADFCDGGQHDAQELFRLLLDSLHHDLNRITKKPAYEEDRDLPGEAETDKAERLWSKYLGRDNSPITDLFGGQLQSTVHCHQCKGNFTTYEPFWDLSLPIVKEGKGAWGAWLSGKSIPTTIQDCLQAFTADEVLQGDEAFKCEVCNKKCEATKRLRLFRLPQVLLLHIKRFKYTGSSREKLTNNVTFPIKGLKLNQFVSSVSSPADSNANYDLYAVSNHYGSMAGGHYTAACRVGLPEGREQWYNFNDDAVSKLSPQSVVTPCAYMLFYVRTE